MAAKSELSPVKLEDMTEDYRCEDELKSGVAGEGVALYTA